MKNLIFVISLYLISFSLFSQDYYSDYNLENEALIHGNIYKLDTLKGIYYLNKDSIYGYEPYEKYFFNGMSLKEFEKQQVEMSNLINSFASDTPIKTTGLPRVRMNYQSFIDSINISYEKLDIFFVLSKGEIYKAVTYSNIIDDAIFHNMYSDSTNNTYYARKMNLYQIPDIAKQYKIKFDSIFNQYCIQKPDAYEVQAGTTKYLADKIGNISMNYKIDGTRVRQVLINFYQTCPIKSYWLEKNKLMTVSSEHISEFAFCIIIFPNLGTPEIIGFPTK
ncbi:hypothetical protein V9L05_14880 [Bernardetia sp. Wsw4-3y2]|uniref:hypothetical protein n=1 Tax=Bernardetia sp. Wsw4-3y2 TaxID=3127471 RepID=UPI0030CE3325